MPGAEGWQLSNPSIVSLAVLASVDGYFSRSGDGAIAGEERVADRLFGIPAEPEGVSQNFSIITPREKERRGAQLSIRIPQNGRALCERLAREGIVGDWREPDTFRVAPVPLYNSYQMFSGLRGDLLPRLARDC